jgi:hypothetical protein
MTAPPSGALSVQQFTRVDPETWKRIRPVLATTLIPIAAALGFFALATYAKKTPSVADRPSMAAFDACLSEHGLQSQGNYATQFDAQVAAQQQMKVCGSKIPASVIRSWQQQAEASRASFRECMHNMAGSSGVHGFGRFRGGSSRDFDSMRNAFVICRSLLQQGDSGGRVPNKPLGTPVAPIA